MVGCLQVVPFTKLGLSGNKSSIKTDSSFLGQYICRSFHTLYCSVWDTNIKAPPAETTVGLCSILYPVILMLLMSWFFCKSLLSIMHIITNLVSRRSRKVTSLLMCEDKDDMFKCNDEDSCCFILIYLNSSISK